MGSLRGPHAAHLVFVALFHLSDQEILVKFRGTFSLFRESVAPPERTGQNFSCGWILSCWFQFPHLKPEQKTDFSEFKLLVGRVFFSRFMSRQHKSSETEAPRGEQRETFGFTV